MKPGPIFIIKCPNCKTKYKKPSLISGNTFGAKRWTDGKVEAPMMPRYTKIIKCGECCKFFWVDDAEVVDKIPYFETEKYKDVQKISQNTPQEILEAINNIGEIMKIRNLTYG